MARFELPLPEWLSPPFSSGVQAKSSDRATINRANNLFIRLNAIIGTAKIAFFCDIPNLPAPRQNKTITFPNKRPKIIFHHKALIINTLNTPSTLLQLWITHKHLISSVFSPAVVKEIFLDLIPAVECLICSRRAS